MLRHLSVPANRVSKRNFSTKFVALGRVIEHWDSIIGADMVEHAQPVRIHNRNYSKKRGAKPECILDIACSSSHAMILQYQKSLILERMTNIFGNRWVTDIRFTATQALKTPKRTINRIEKRDLCDQDHDFIDDSLAHLDNDPIKDTLRRMGAHILQEQESE